MGRRTGLLLGVVGVVALATVSHAFVPLSARRPPQSHAPALAGRPLYSTPAPISSTSSSSNDAVDEAIVNAAIAAAEQEAKEQPEEQEGPSGPRDFYSVNAADEGLAEAQERYAQARARRERFLMEAQKNFQRMTQRADEELQAFVAQEEEAAQALEKRAAEIKEVKQEMTALVKEADELMGGPKGFVVSFDVVTALSVLVVLDTFYVSYLAYRGSEMLTASLGTELILGGFLFFKIKQREAAQLEKDAAASAASSNTNQQRRA